MTNTTQPLQVSVNRNQNATGALKDAIYAQLDRMREELKGDDMSEARREALKERDKELCLILSQI